MSDVNEGHWNRFRPPVGDRPPIEVMDDTSAEINGNTSLDLLQAIYRSADQPMHRRMRAAIAALPHEHPKLAVTSMTINEGFGAKLDAARERSAKVIDFRPGEPALAAPGTETADGGVAHAKGASDIG
jgi:hypothetical protein